MKEPTTLTRITVETKKRLKKLAAEQDTTILDLIERAIKESLLN